MRALLGLCLLGYSTLALSAGGRDGNVLIMGYNLSAKPPLIAAAPDNAGAYFDLYNRAAQRMGFRLRVVRYPKRRVYSLMRKGEVDFYPGMKFQESRLDFAYFIPNGLPTGRTGISRADMPEVKNIHQLQGKRVILPLDGVDYTAGVEGVHITRIRVLDIDKAYRLLHADRADFYATDDIVVASFLANKDARNIRVHSRFLPVRRMTLGFSRRSPYFRVGANPAYNASRPRSVDNDPVTPVKNSAVARLQSTIEDMIRDGEIEQIRRDYYEPE